MTITIEFLGHSGFLIKGKSHAVAIDPFLTGNPVAVQSPDQVKCTHLAISHGHADHYGPDTLAIAKANNAAVHAPYEICEHLNAQGHENTQPMNPGGRVATDFGAIALTHAIHSSSYQGQYMGNATGVIVQMDGVTVYHAGDTALFSDMKLIGDLYRPTVAILPIGDRFTMGPEDATRAARLISPRIAIPCHYDTWPPISVDPNEFNPEGVEVIRLKPGQSTSI
ncbi:MAG: metal-dependent hydrolase [Phycisphaerales bacterium]